MPKQKISREEIIARAADVFRKHGYTRTSMSDIAEATGLLKGSLYHHFPSKEDLMQEVLENACKETKDYTAANVYDNTVPAKKRLKHLLTEAFGGLEMVETGGCLFGNASLEISGENESFRRRSKTFFDEWIKAVTFIYNENHTKAKARKLAEQALQEYEGAIMLSKIYKDPKYFKNTVARLIARV